MQFKILGRLAVRDAEGQLVPLGGPRPRTVLAALLVRRGDTVGVNYLVDDVWGEQLPDDPGRTLRTYASRIRARLDDPQRLTREGSGYRLAVDADELDLARFEHLTEQGRELLAAGRAEPAGTRLREALDLWRGEPLADLDGAPLLAWVRPRLWEQWFGTLEARIEADLATGRNGELVGELQALLERYPLRERLVGQLMRALYGSGRQVEALEAFRDARRHLVDELGVEPSAELVAVQQQILRQDPDLGPDRTTAPREVTTTGVPRALTSFVGRGAELVAIRSLLEEARLVTLTGIGGAGKTRLATEVARQHAERDDARVCFVALASVDDPALIARSVADGVGLPVTGPDPAGQLGSYLQDDELLLVVDNCEHVGDSVAGLVDQLLRQCGGVQVLATSRQPLGCAGERVWRLPPLRVPPDRPGLPTEEIAAFEAVRLFGERARAADPTFVLDERSAPSVARACRCVDGIPLAIELAASRVRGLSIDELATRLERSLTLLRSSSPTAADRHRTLEATLDWSYELLDEPARALLRRLAVFRSSFSLDGIEWMAAAADGVGADDVVDLLDHLVACWLVESDVQRGGNAPYRLLEPVRLYATEHLEREGEDDDDALRTAHARWWLERMQRGADLLRRDGRVPEVVSEGQFDDLRAALGWAVTASHAELAQRLVAACYVFWWAYGLMHEGVGWARQAVGLDADTPAEVRGSCLAGLAMMEMHFGHQDTLRDANEARRLLEAVPDPDRPAAYRDALQTIAHTEILEGDLDAGEQRARKVAAEGERRDDHWSQGMARTGLGLAAVRRGDLDEAYETFTRLRRWARQRDATLGVIATGYHQGMVALERGDHQLARQHLETVIQEKQRTGSDPFGRAHGHLPELEALVRACLEQDDTEAARRHATAGAEAARDLADEPATARFAEFLDDLGES